MLDAKSVYRFVRIGLTVAIVVMVLFLYYRFRFVSITPGCDSVAPDFTNVTRVIVDRFPLWRGHLERGDIVVYEALVGEKRVRHFAAVAAMPGEVVDNRGGKLHVEEEPTNFPAVKAADESDRVPEGMYLLFNTNPRSSIPDSRAFGFVNGRAIHGRVGAVVPF